MIPGPSELLIIFGVALLLFGPSKLPQLGSAIGESIRNFKKGMNPKEGDTKEPQGSQPLLATQVTPGQASAAHESTEAAHVVTAVPTEAKTTVPS